MLRDPNPVVCLEKRLLYSRPGPVPEEPYAIPLGLADIKRPGTDVTIVATGACVHQALQASRSLARTNIDCEVIDPRTLKPLDLPTILHSIAKTGRLVVVNEGPRTGGYAADIVARVTDHAFTSLKAAPQRVTATDTPIPYAATLERTVLPSVDAIETAARTTLAEG
jgi:pyruvate dehydrogenase E1 component beta subunit